VSDPREPTIAPTTPPPSFDLEANLATIDRLRDLDASRTLSSHFGPGEQGAAVAELDDYETVLQEFVAAVDRTRSDVDDDLDAILAALRPEWESPTLRRDVVGGMEYLDHSA
jgi:hypothetical protein